MNIDLRKFIYKNDYRSRQDLFKLAFPETINTDISTDAHYDWKFRSNLMPVSSYQYIAENNRSQLLGYYAALPFSYSINGQPALCGMVCDVMTHPNTRGQGVFTKLGTFATSSLKDEKVDFVSGYPIRNEVIPGHLKVGWFIAFKAPMYIHVLKVNSLIKSLPIIRSLTPLFNAALFLINSIVVVSTKNNYSIRELSYLDFFNEPDYHDFFTRWAKTQENYLIKSFDFLKWRTGAPGTKYSFSKMYHHSKLVGVSISRVTILKNIPSLAIIDIMLDDNHLGASNLMLSHLKKIAVREKCEAVIIMINTFWCKKYNLLKNLFIKSPAIFSVIFKILNTKLDVAAFKNTKNWHLTWVDSDDL